MTKARITYSKVFGKTPDEIDLQTGLDFLECTKVSNLVIGFNLQLGILEEYILASQKGYDYMVNHVYKLERKLIADEIKDALN